MRQECVQSQDDDFRDYRELCEARLKRLERYKKSKSFYSLENVDEASTSDSFDPSTEEAPTTSGDVFSKFDLPQHRTPYDLLREKMISLMETDQQLLKQLLHLGDTIKELRGKQPPLQRSTSEVSLCSSGNREDDELEDELCPMVERSNAFNGSMSAITHFYVHDEHDTENDESENQPNLQYFSRKNSVLRIPIPARASNRILGGKKIPRRPSELSRPRPYSSNKLQGTTAIPVINSAEAIEDKPCQPLQVEETESSCQASPTLSQHSTDNQSTLSSCCENERKVTLSAASIDSGIRDDEMASPVNDQKQTVDV